MMKVALFCYGGSLCALQGPFALECSTKEIHVTEYNRIRVDLINEPVRGYLFEPKRRESPSLICNQSQVSGAFLGTPKKGLFVSLDICNDGQSLLIKQDIAVSVARKARQLGYYSLARIS
jgi:hypothetical protein